MVNEIPYLDMVISESLRLYPPALRADRVSSSDYHYKDMKIPKGTVWAVPIYALHHDADLYPNPETFDPERYFLN
jgi:cytochrome P450